MEKKISNKTILKFIPLIVLFIIIGFFYPVQLLNIFNTYWPLILIVIGILQTLNTRFKDFVSAILLMITGGILLIFKLKVLSSEILLNGWDGSLKGLILSIFDWLFMFLNDIIF